MPPKKFKDRTKKQKDKLVNDLKELETYLKKELNIQIYLHYGTLLGAVRENNLIPNDDDIDIAYLGKAKNKKEAIKEIQEINKKLEDLGLLKLIKDKWKKKGYALGQCFVYSLDKKNSFDLYHTWKDGGRYICPHQDDIGLVKDYFPLEDCRLGNHTFKIPKNSKKLLFELYGDWETPSQTKTTKKNPFKWVLRKSIS